MVERLNVAGRVLEPLWRRYPGSIITTTFTPFSIFVVFYATAFMLEMVEQWMFFEATVAWIVISAILLLRVTRVNFLLYLITMTTYLLAFRFPEVANHVNLMIFINMALIGGLVFSLIRRSMNTDEAFYNAIQPILRLLVIATFAVAGFHKLNRDFVDPTISCLRDFSRVLWWTFRADFIGIGVPSGAVIAAVALGYVVSIWRGTPNLALPAVDWKGVAAPAVAIAVLAAALLAITGTDAVASSYGAAIFFLSVFVLCWQLVEGPLLLVPRFQWIALTLSMLVHAQLAMIKIVDFQAVVIALFIAFIPPEIWRAWGDRATCGIGPFRAHRVLVYLLLNMLGGAFMLVVTQTSLDFPAPRVVPGILFNTGILIMLWPIVSDIFSSDRSWRWRGVPVLHPSTPRLLYLVPVLLVVFGMTSHFGLRTAGNFSMFSNLRTEGETSNHLLFGSNPLKFASYQEDLVYIREIDDELAEIGYQWKPLEGHALPVVEFRKLLKQWREDGRVIPIVFDYQGRTVRSDDIANDPEWRVNRTDWEMLFFDFRIVTAEEKNACRW